MLEHLFGSKTRVKLLGLLLDHPNKSYFVRELTRELGVQINSIRRELSNLERDDVVVSHERMVKEDSQKKYYRINANFLLYPELKALFLKARLLIEKDLIKKIQNLGKVQYLVLTGNFVGLADLSTDLLIVGGVNRQKLKRLIDKFQKDLGGEINYTVLSGQEFKYRKDITDRFLYGILENKKIVVVDQFRQKGK